MFDGVRALGRGFWTVLRHAAQPPITVTYPEVKRPLPAAFRGRHRLHRHEDGLERCIGCELCAAACPSAAILVQAADNDPAHPVSTGERYAEVYEINMIRCIFCGYCEEACPVDAIRLGPEYELADFTRPDFVYTKEMLLDPEKYAPKRQYHADVDQSDSELTREIPDDEDLGEVYRTHRPLGAPRDRPPEQEHHPLA
ncbi:MAG TPA: NADH-quinone oxidoreductase subunit NuoI [Chloroflexota bacterium]|nr:NADH-quinone oxidoreductase subunit NuoI [Chloroflexota bacterium]